MGNLRRAQGLLDQGATPLQIIRQIFPDFDVSRVAMMSENAVRLFNFISFQTTYFRVFQHFALLSDLLERAPIRQKLPEFNSLADAVELFKTRKNILILTGAGVSVSCGIPDFRSKDGIYARLRGEFPNLPDPTAMFDIRYFRNNPAPFYNFARVRTKSLDYFLIRIMKNSRKFSPDNSHHQYLIDSSKNSNQLDVFCETTLKTLTHWNIKLGSNESSSAMALSQRIRVQNVEIKRMEWLFGRMFSQ